MIWSGIIDDSPLTQGKIIVCSRNRLGLKEKAMENESSAPNSHDFICPICLGPFIQPSYLDHCLHQFCFNCILRWIKVVSGKHHHTPPPSSSVKCPLCKVCLFLSLHLSYISNFIYLSYYSLWLCRQIIFLSYME